MASNKSNGGPTTIPIALVLAEQAAADHSDRVAEQYDQGQATIADLRQAERDLYRAIRRRCDAETELELERGQA